MARWAALRERYRDRIDPHPAYGWALVDDEGYVIARAHSSDPTELPDRWHEILNAMNSSGAETAPDRKPNLRLLPPQHDGQIFFSARQCASIFAVSTSTVRRWIHAGRLKRAPFRDIRVHRSELERLILRSVSQETSTGQ